MNKHITAKYLTKCIFQCIIIAEYNINNSKEQIINLKLEVELPDLDIKDEESKNFLLGLLNLLNEKKGENITIFDVEKITTIAKFIIIITANSQVHSASLTGYVIDYFKENNLEYLLYSKDPDLNNPWILIDGTDFIINIFVSETRNFYSLENLFFKGKLLYQS